MILIGRGLDLEKENVRKCRSGAKGSHGRAEQSEATCAVLRVRSLELERGAKAKRERWKMKSGGHSTAD